MIEGFIDLFVVVSVILAFIVYDQSNYDYDEQDEPMWSMVRIFFNLNVT